MADNDATLDRNHPIALTQNNNTDENKEEQTRAEKKTTSNADMRDGDDGELTRTRATKSPVDEQQGLRKHHDRGKKPASHMRNHSQKRPGSKRAGTDIVKSIHMSTHITCSYLLCAPTWT
jgi:hypothetical protein